MDFISTRHAPHDRFPEEFQSGSKDAILWNININDDKFPVDIENDCDHASFGLAPGLCITDTLPRGMELKDGRITVKKSGQEITMTEGVHYVLTGEPGEQTLIIHIPAEL